jgi:nicotinamide-nucleotide adenylyltransferase
METTQNTGLAVMRMQPMHNGHYELISKMMKEMDTVIIGLGSIQETHTTSNPYTPKQRREMVEKVFGATGKHSKIKIVELKDLCAVSKIAWAMHVFGKIDGMNLPKPTHYYAGSKHDASWFDSVNDEFGVDTLRINIVDRLHDTICMSATEIRKAIMDESDDWKEYTPPVVVNYIEGNFPHQLKLSETIDLETEKLLFEARKNKKS